MGLKRKKGTGIRRKKAGQTVRDFARQSPVRKASQKKKSESAKKIEERQRQERAGGMRRGRK